jgi:putative endonuclease
VRRTRQAAHIHGHRAETIAVWYMRLKGYRLIANRFKSAVGEIDLIMRKGKTLVFIEVKARSKVDDSMWAVTPQQSSRIASAASLFVCRHDLSGVEFQRFDIVAVPSYLWPTHIKNAFDGKL